MRPETKFRELKNKIIDELRGLIYCTIKFSEEPQKYLIVNKYNDEFSYIELYKEKLTRPYISITFENLSYYASIKIFSEKTAKMLLLDARIAETCKDYLSIIEELMTYEIQYELIREILFDSRQFSLYQTEYDILQRIIYDDGDIILKYIYRRGDEITEHQIFILKKSRTLFFEVYKNFGKVEREIIRLEEVPRVFDSITSYILKISNLNDYFRLEKTIMELIRLINVEKRDIRDAIKELAEKYGYWDVFY